MPYALEIARVISYGEASEFSYFMTDELRGIFIKSVYEELESTKLSFKEFSYDVRLACLNEIIEFLEYNFNNPEELRDKYFELDFKRVNKVAGESLDRQNSKELIFLEEGWG